LSRQRRLWQPKRQQKPRPQPGTRLLPGSRTSSSPPVGAENDRRQLTVIGKNLTNKFYFFGGSTDNASLGDIIAYRAMPRTVRLQVPIKY
jgi:hypothetical protein